MRILYVSIGYDSSKTPGGAAFTGRELFKRIGKRHKVFFLLSKKIRIENVKVIPLKQKQKGSTKAEQVSFVTGLKIRQKIPKVDVVVCSYWASFPAANQVAEKQNAKLAVIYRMPNSIRKANGFGRPEEKGVRDAIEAQMGEKSGLIVANSEYEKKVLVKEFGQGIAEKTRVISPGVKIKRLKLKRSKVLFASRLEKEKGIYDFLTVAKTLKGRQFEICNVGSELEAVKKLAPKNCRVADWVEHDEMNRNYSSSKVLFLPSKAETFGNVTLEAMACGTPVVGYAEGAGILVENGKTGFIVENPTEAAKAIELLFENKRLWNKMSKNCIKFSRKFTWEKTSKAWEKELERIAG